jgi:TRAP-type C4-dicarboxylate transport system substrate-binding protein
LGRNDFPAQIDGLEMPVGEMAATKAYELAPYVAKTNHAVIITACLMNKKTFDQLTPVLQAALTEAAKEAAIYPRDVALTMEEEKYGEIAAGGAKTNDVNPEIFYEAVKAVYEKCKEEPGLELFDVIQETE